MRDFHDDGCLSINTSKWSRQLLKAKQTLSGQSALRAPPFISENHGKTTIRASPLAFVLFGQKIATIQFLGIR
jgi:hypothetical protein